MCTLQSHIKYGKKKCMKKFMTGQMVQGRTKLAMSIDIFMAEGV
jgi:hypothetical protein